MYQRKQASQAQTLYLWLFACVCLFASLTKGAPPAGAVRDLTRVGSVVLLTPTTCPVQQARCGPLQCTSTPQHNTYVTTHCHSPPLKHGCSISFSIEYHRHSFSEVCDGWAMCAVPTCDFPCAHARSGAAEVIGRADDLQPMRPVHTCNTHTHTQTHTDTPFADMQLRARTHLSLLCCMSRCQACPCVTSA